MRNPAISAIGLFYSVVALILAIVLVVVGRSSVMGVGAEALSSACENLALIVIALGVWVQRK